jgi:uracil-DNA glycosylase
VDPRQLSEHLKFYSELGVTGISRDARWRSRTSNSQFPTPKDMEGTEHTEETGPGRIFTLTEIREDLGDCTRCKLHQQGRKQIVFGVGSPNADVMFVGEAPGADEDIQGIPFVGRAGQLLTKMIEAMGFRREDVYIANVIKCRPPQNRNPEPDEVASCEPFLFNQIDAIRPKVIVALGSFAAKALLKTQEPISRLRGRVYDYHGAKLIPTFHPSFLLRSPDQKKFAWEDLKLALAEMGRVPPRSAGAAAAHSE